MTSAEKEVIQAEVTKSINIFINGMNVSAKELPAIIGNVAEAISMISKDAEIIQKIQNTAKVYGQVVGEFTQAYLDMAMKINDEIDSYDGLMKGYALRHPVDSLSLMVIKSKIKKSWNNIKKSWSPK